MRSGRAIATIRTPVRVIPPGRYLVFPGPGVLSDGAAWPAAAATMTAWPPAARPPCTDCQTGARPGQARSAGDRQGWSRASRLARSGQPGSRSRRPAGPRRTARTRRTPSAPRRRSRRPGRTLAPDVQPWHVREPDTPPAHRLRQLDERTEARTLPRQLPPAVFRSHAGGHHRCDIRLAHVAPHGPRPGPEHHARPTAPRRMGRPGTRPGSQSHDPGCPRPVPAGTPPRRPRLLGRQHRQAVVR